VGEIRHITIRLFHVVYIDYSMLSENDHIITSQPQYMQKGINIIIYIYIILIEQTCKLYIQQKLLDFENSLPKD